MLRASGRLHTRTPDNDCDTFREAAMNEKAQDEEFEEDESDDLPDDDVDVDVLFRDMDKRKRAGVKPGDPAWRKLERYREERHTADLVSDFDDYDIGMEDGERPHRQRRAS
jgi:hypothetical protein